MAAATAVAGVSVPPSPACARFRRADPSQTPAERPGAEAEDDGEGGARGRKIRARVTGRDRQSQTGRAEKEVGERD
jgi:hypothetical protein